MAYSLMGLLFKHNSALQFKGSSCTRRRRGGETELVPLSLQVREKAEGGGEAEVAKAEAAAEVVAAQAGVISTEQQTIPLP